MRMLPMLMLSAALMAPAGQLLSQDLPGNPPAFTLTQDQLTAMLAQCRAGNCAASVQQLIALARAAGLSREEFSAVVATIATTLIEATRNDPALAAEVVAALTAASSDTRGELSDMLVQVALLISSGNIDDIDLVAIAQVVEPTEVDNADEEEPTGGDTGSDA